MMNSHSRGKSYYRIMGHRNTNTQRHSNNYRPRCAGDDYAPEYTITPFRYRCNKPIRHQHDCFQLLVSAFYALDTDQEADNVPLFFSSTSKYVSKSRIPGEIPADAKEGSVVGIEILTSLLTNPYEVGINNGSSFFSFQRVFVPLVKVLSHPRLLNCSYIGKINSIYRAIYTNLDFENVVECIKELFEQPLPLQAFVFSNKYPKDVSSKVETMDLKSVSNDVVLPFIKVCQAMLSRVPEAQHDIRIFEVFKDLSKSLPLITEPSTKSIISKELNILYKRLDKSVVKGDEKEKESLRENYGFPPLKQTEKRIVDLNQGPGELGHNKRPLHDNDFVDFRRVCILPTTDEVLCEHAAFIPKNGYSPYIEDDTLSYLDCHFRMLREDMLSEYRSMVQFYIQNYSSLVVSNQDYVGEGSSKLVIMRNVALGPLVPCKKKMAFKIFFEQLNSIKMQKRTERKTYWEEGYGSKILSVNSLVCFVIAPNLEEIKRPVKLLFAIVANKDTDQLAPQGTWDKSSVLITSYNPSRTRSGSSSCVELYEQFTAEVKPKRRVTITMLQLRGHFLTGYEPFLRALQLHGYGRLPLFDIITPFIDKTDNSAAAETPQYLRNKQLDFSCLLKNGSDMSLAVDATTFSSLKSSLLKYERDLTIDQTQIDALALVLTRPVPLIQGPPGTGKTYIGIKLVQLLLDNSLQLLSRCPILCVCFTNHALDQFLEGLVACNVPCEDILRIGGKSTSSSIPNLYSVNTTAIDLSFHERQHYASLVNELKDAEHSFAKSREGVFLKHDDVLPVLGYIQECYPAIYKSLMTNDVYSEICNTIDTSRFSFEINKFWCRMTFLEEKYMQREMFFIEELMMICCAAEDEKINPNFSNGSSPVLWKTKEIEIRLQVFFSEGVAINSAEKAYGSIPEFIDFAIKRDSKTSELCVWLLPVHLRAQLWSQMVKELNKVSMKRNLRAGRKIECLEMQLEEARNNKNLKLIRNVKVVGITTNGAASRFDLIQALQPKVIICEEASEVLESHLISCLAEMTEHLILIGDHFQLCPKVQEFKLTRQKNDGYALDLSMFERLINKFQSCNSRDPLFVTLETQRRMRPEISCFVRNTLYPNLKDDSGVTKYPNVQGLSENVWFFDHSYPESSNSSSYSNLYEAQMTVGLIKYFMLSGYHGRRLAVLTPYVGQLLLLKRLLRPLSTLIEVNLNEKDQELCEKIRNEDEVNEYAVCGNEERPDSTEDQEIITDGNRSEDIEDTTDEDNTKLKAEVSTSSLKHKSKSKKPNMVSVSHSIRLATVDNFQGEEADLVIISTVRNNSNGSLGFMKVSNRVNVMISRAKHGMIILGSILTIQQSNKAVMMNEILKMLAKNCLIGEHIPIRCSIHQIEQRISNPYDFEVLAPHGGCTKLCSERLFCGHRCQLTCHVNDREHKYTKCMKPCERVIKNCGHNCELQCFEKCSGCTKKVEVGFNCGHSVEVLCKDRENARCQFVFKSFKLPHCEHRKDLTCEEVQELKKGYALNALTKDHPAFSCSAVCDVELSTCGHSCRSSCGNCCFITMQSQKDQRLQDIGGLIGCEPIERTIHPICRSKCDRLLHCGHICKKGICHKIGECPSCTQGCQIQCSHSTCTKKCNDPCVLCVEKCEWKCSNPDHNDARHSCELACGIPCNRLPCNFRCTKTLSCGHRCISLCGEPCPSPEFCKECAEIQIQSSVVDLILFTSFQDFQLNDSNALVVLDCKHVFTTETIDGFLGLPQFYEMTPSGQFYSVENNLMEMFSKFLSGDRTAVCPSCRSPIRNVRRYNRIIKLHDIVQSYKTYRKTMAERIAAQKDLVDQMSKRLEISPVVISNRKDMAKEITTLCRDVSDLVIFSKKRNPIAGLRTATLRAINSHFIKPKDALILTLDNVAYLDGLELNCKTAVIQLKFFTQTIKRTVKAPNQCAKINDEAQRLIITCRNRMREFANAAEGNIGRIRTNVTLLSVMLEFEVLCTFQALATKLQDGSSLVANLLRSIKMQRDIVISIINGSVGNLDPAKEADLSLINKLQALKEQVIGINGIIEFKLVYDTMNKELGAPRTGFGGRWYMCPNKHIYTIGECGGAVEESKCPECGQIIGGSNHRLTSGNSPATDFIDLMESMSLQM